MMIANATKNFLRAWAFALRWESKTVELVSGDAGGLTKFGVDQASHPHVNIRALTSDQAGQIYHDDEWTRCRCDDLPDGLAVAVFDCAMTSGKGTAIAMLQRVVDVKPDGFIGPKTVQAASGFVGPQADDAVNQFLIARSRFLQTAAMRGQNHKFLAGWLNRNNDLRKLLLADGGATAAGLGTPAAKTRRGVAASGSVGLAAPLSLAVLSLVGTGTASMDDFTLKTLAALVALAVAAYYITGLLVNAKKLREKPSEYPAMPSPVVVRHADQFASQEQVQKIETDLRNQMKELRAYVHEAVHVINQSVGKISTQLHEQGEQTQAYFEKLDAKNELRVQRIAERVDEVIDRTPEKIINLLRQTGALKP